MTNNYSKETICLQGGYTPKAGEPRVLPLYQSTTYYYDDPEFVQGLFDLKEEGHIYSRISNPTVGALEEKVAKLASGIGALATSSGQAAILLTLCNLCEAGDHIISSSNIYGGTFNLLNVTLKKLGIQATFVDPDASLEEILAAVKENTKAIYAETFGNPSLKFLDFEKFSKAAKAADVPFIVDNTLATPYLFNSLENGADIEVHSTTKYIDGHARCLGGLIVDGGTFNWKNGKFKSLVDPDPSYHGLSYTESFGNAAFLTRARTQYIRDFGCCLSPFNAFLTDIGLETLHLRMKAHSENALKLAEYLEKHPKVNWANYPLLKSSPTYELASKYLEKGGSGVLTFGIKGGTDAATKFMKSLKLTAIVVHVGDARTSILHPATSTHRQLTSEELIDAGVPADLLRVSVGIEGIDDIIADFEQAFGEI